MSAQIQNERKSYYEILEKSQKNTLDITSWLLWFLNCLSNSIQQADQQLEKVLNKHRFWSENSSVVLNERQRFMIQKLLGEFVGKLSSSKWAKMTKCSSDTALRDINDLLAKSILQKEPGGGRSTNYRLI